LIGERFPVQFRLTRIFKSDFTFNPEAAGNRLGLTGTPHE
jgi:hypothetical protein